MIGATDLLIEYSNNGRRYTRVGKEHFLGINFDYSKNNNFHSLSLGSL